MALIDQLLVHTFSALGPRHRRVLLQLDRASQLISMSIFVIVLTLHTRNRPLQIATLILLALACTSYVVTYAAFAANDGATYLNMALTGSILLIAAVNLAFVMRTRQAMDVMFITIIVLVLLCGVVYGLKFPECIWANPIVHSHVLLILFVYGFVFLTACVLSW